MNTDNSTPRPRRNRRRVIGIIAATLMAVAGIALVTMPAGSGAYFNDTEQAQFNAATGDADLTLSDSVNAATCVIDFGVVNPGGEKNKTCKVTNTGTTNLVITASNLVPTVTAPNGNPDMSLFSLRVEIYLPETAVTALPSTVNLGSLAPGQSRTYTVWFKVGAALGNEGEGMTLAATVDVTGTQN